LAGLLVWTGKEDKGIKYTVLRLKNGWNGYSIVREGVLFDGGFHEMPKVA
jgi:hypothetical protein